MSKIKQINPFDLYTLDQLIEREKEMWEKHDSMFTGSGGIQGYWELLTQIEYRESIKILQGVIAERVLLCGK